MGIRWWPLLRELTRPTVREKDTMMSCRWIFEKEGGTDTIKEKEIKWRGGSLVVFCPPCGSMRAVIKDWLVVMWSCCHGGLYVSSRHEDQCCRPNEFCSVIYQKKAISFSYLTLPKNFPSLKKKKKKSQLYVHFTILPLSASALFKLLASHKGVG